MPSPINERINAHEHDLGDGFIIHRVLPSSQRRAVGPFVFMDYFGPVTLPATKPMDVRPHPHIGLATVTYLWEGRIEHRDSLGNTQIIEPGAVNWMTAGRGIVHSERTAAADRGSEQRMHGLQLWVALPLANEADEPSFEHADAASLPQIAADGARLRIIAGNAYGARSPVSTHGDLFYVDAYIKSGATLRVTDDHIQRAAFLIEGSVSVGNENLQPGQLCVFAPGAAIELRAHGDSHVVMLGGAPLDAPRYIWWNYVSSSREVLAQAQDDWARKRFAMVEDDPEFIPLPEDRRVTVMIRSD